MSSLNLVDTAKATFSIKFAFALVMSLLLTACGGGAGGEDAVVDSANLETQTPADDINENTPETVAPVQITTQPQSVTKNAGESASFAVAASGGGSLSFQWRKGGQDILGATSNSLVLTSVSETDTALYSVVVSNSAGSQNSLSALLTVNTPVVVEPTVDPVVIISQPQAITVAENSPASFSVQVTGDGEINYQWLKNGEIINGENASSLTLASVSTADIASYSVVVSNSQGPVISESASLDVTIAQSAGSIELTWDIPQAREDGSDLPLFEINGYVIAYGTEEGNLSSQLTVDGASTTNTILADLTSGTYYFSIATVDSDGVQGAYSNVIQQSI